MGHRFVQFVLITLSVLLCASTKSADAQQTNHLLSVTHKFQNPINPGADPWLVYFNGNYYLTTTQGDCIRMWKAPTLAALKTAKPMTIWKDSDPSRSRGIWAPEFHFISNRWYLYYTATSIDNRDDLHRMHVLESAGTDPLGPYKYKARLWNPTNDQYAIDGTVFQKSNGSLYFLWAARPGHVLYIARMPHSWKQFPKPVFERNDANQVFGPGHNGFFRSPDGAEDWIVYHAKASSNYTYEARTTRAQKFTWTKQGLPDFGVPLPLDANLDEPSTSSVAAEVSPR